MLVWIDSSRALCMCLIYLAHAYAYCDLFREEWKGGLIIVTNMFVVVSGYLFYRHHDKCGSGPNVLRQDVQNVACRLVLPTLLFSFALYFPKLLFNGENFEWGVFLERVLGGKTFWFTSALAVCQLLYSLLFFLTFIPRRLHLLIVLPLAAAGIFSVADCNLWRWQDGLEFMLYYALGGLYFMYEERVTRWFAMCRYLWGLAFAALLAVYVSHPVYSWLEPGFVVFQLACFPMGIIVFRLSPFEKLSYIGRNSLAFYLLSGLTPAVFATLYGRWLGTESAVVPLLVFASALGTSLAAVYVLKRWLPWTTDFRKLL